MANAGAGAPATPAEGAEGAVEPQEGAEQQQAAPNADILARLDQFERGVGGRLQTLEDALGKEGDGEGEPEQQQRQRSRFLIDSETGEYVDRITGQVVDDPTFNEPEPMSREQLEQLIETKADERAAEKVAPALEFVHQQQIAALEEAYPAMRDGEVAKGVIQEARAMAQRLGNSDAWSDPEVLEHVFLAQQARERAEQEVPATGRQSTELEDPAAGPQGAEAADIADQIVQARPGGGYWK